MIIGIDASNIRAGGGITHLSELLQAAQPQQQGVDHVIVWGGKQTLKQLPSQTWLEKAGDLWLDRTLLHRACWQYRRLPSLAKNSCDLLFTPGGTYSGAFSPYVSMSQNMLVFDTHEQRRYGVSIHTLRFRLLRRIQNRSFRRAQGIIFLSDYARTAILRQLNCTRIPENVTIAHGVNDRFRAEPRHPQTLGAYSYARPLRLLYVSHITVYKHQWHIADAVARLRRSGLPIKLDLVGAARKGPLKHLQRVMRQLDPDGEYIQYHGPVPYPELHKWYHAADAFVFASSCENMPNTLLEAMASGLPIACSNRGPMPEVLGDAGLYFDPEAPAEIAEALSDLLQDVNLRQEKAWAAHRRAKAFTWERCAHETFSFLARAVQRDQPE